MKVKLSILTICLAFTAHGLFAQDFVFKVLANKGDNTIKAEARDWSALKTGRALQAGEIINISEGAYVGLVHANGTTMEIKKAGQYNVNELAEKLNSKSTGVASKYAEFLLGKINEEEEGKINENYRKHLNVTGAVERSLEKFAITAMIPANGSILSSEAFVRWSEVGAGQTYVVSLKNMFNEVLSTRETSENFIKIDLNDNKLASEKVVIFSVSVKDDANLKSDNYGIKRLAGENAEKMKEEFNLLQAELGKNSPVIKEIMLASFFEKHNLMVDAIAKYETAIAADPEMKDFQTAYGNLIVRNGL